MNNQEIPTLELIAYRVSGIACIDQDYDCHYQIPHDLVTENPWVEGIEGKLFESGEFTFSANVEMTIRDHTELLRLFFKKL
jgi:hypothetical protein